MYTRLEGECLMIEMKGDIDHHHASRIREEVKLMLSFHPVREVVMDFKDAGFMDSSAIGLVLGRYIDANEAGAGLKLINTGERVKKMLKLGGIYKLKGIVIE